jgi:hypothetical protein
MHAGVGAGVGDAVGCSVGCCVGTAVGAGVGAGVGTSSHSLAPSKPAVHVPASQPWHKWYAALSWYLPGGHLRQLRSPSHAVNCPSSQVWQVLPADGWYLPIAHLLQATEPSTAYLPSAQLSHDAAL